MTQAATRLTSMISFILAKQTFGGYYHRHLGTANKNKTKNQVYHCNNGSLQRATTGCSRTDGNSTTCSYDGFESWTTSYGMPNIIMTDNCPHFVSKVFAALGASIGTTLITASEYHLQTNGKRKRFNTTLVAPVRNYIGVHQTDWDNFVQPLAYGFKLHVHYNTKTSSSSSVLSQEPFAASISARRKTPDKYATTLPVLARLKV